VSATCELLDEELVHRGHLPIASRTYRLPTGDTATYEVLMQRPVVCILALTAGLEVVLVRQFRPGPARFCTELPAGLVDPGESPAAAAARELAEETGYTGTLRPAGRFDTNGYSTEVRHVYVCADASKSESPHPDAGEHLEVMTRSLPDLRTMLRDGEMTVTDAVFVALDLL
jgi:ADP-ribose pyrophosphatase